MFLLGKNLLRLYSIYNYYKLLAIFPVLFSISLYLFYFTHSSLHLLILFSCLVPSLFSSSLVTTSSLYLWARFFFLIFTSYCYFVDSTYKWYHRTYAFIWLISLSISSKLIHLSQVAKFHSFLSHLYSSVDGLFGCFHIFTMENNAPINIGVHVCFQISVFYFLQTYTQGCNYWIIQ